MPELAAHPRSRGEHINKTSDTTIHTGSPPLARGTPAKNLIAGIAGRLTPARAGNTQVYLGTYTSPAAHPRSRGEHNWVAQFSCAILGSPPLARGTHAISDQIGQSSRLTPARAGNTSATGISGIFTPAHPRSRGEHGDFSDEDAGGGGSPPLARGTPSEADQLCQGARLTPARAGNTYSEMM